jgi:hypothetical protein
MKISEPVKETPRQALDGYWPDERPVSTLIANLFTLTEAGALTWQISPIVENYHSAIRIGVTPHDLHSIVGEMATTLVDYTITIYKTVDKEKKPYFYFAVSSDKAMLRIVESDEHRNLRLWSMFDIVGQNGNLHGKVSFLMIDKAHQQALESANTMFAN